MAAEATENRPVRTDSASDGDDTSDANNQKTGELRSRYNKDQDDGNRKN